VHVYEGCFLDILNARAAQAGQQAFAVPTPPEGDLKDAAE
jgi:hypothetical protein